jgi:hypothetical protein
MDRRSGFGRLAQLDVMMLTSGAGVATALAQELYGSAGRSPLSTFDSPCQQAHPAARTPAAPARAARWDRVPCPPAGHVA